MVGVSANTIVGSINDEIFLLFALKSVEEFIDEYVIVYTGKPEHKNLDRIKAFKEETKKPVKILEIPFTDFSAARNVALKHSRYEFIHRVDADEVHYREVGKLKKFLEYPDVVGLKVHFFHFMMDFNHYEAVYPKVDIFKIVEGTHYEGKVHEQLVAAPSGLVLDTGYHFAHYGYVKCCSSDTLISTDKGLINIGNYAEDLSFVNKLVPKKVNLFNENGLCASRFFYYGGLQNTLKMVTLSRGHPIIQC